MKNLNFVIISVIKRFTPLFLLNWYHFILALFGAILYQFPFRFRQGFGGQAKKLRIIGVTGTNGKSTVVDMITRILEEAGYKTASLSSIKFKIGQKEWQNTLKMTMPGRFKIQKFLRQTLKEGCQYAVLEVTSEGILQHRHRFIDFEIAVFTNLSPEHIEVHKSFENYKKTKGKLFAVTKNIHILNLDDKNADYFLKFPAKKKFGFTTLEADRDPSSISIIRADNIQILPSGLKFLIKDKEFNLKLLGEFNIYNSLAAICVGLSQNISLEVCKNALEKIETIPGRMELVIAEPFRVFVDYAITPNALEKVYQTLATRPGLVGKLICVLGACGGGRDKWKRPIFGEIAAKYCSKIIVTDEDPYDENPYQILSMIKSGISKSQFPMTNFYEILDRREAIKKALSLAQPKDSVIITGKGCEPWICVEDGKKIPWDDRRVVKEEYKNLKIKNQNAK